MRLIQVSTNCYYSTPEDATDRPCLGYIKTSKYTGVMIDAGASENHAKAFMELLKKNNLPYPSLCILTHSHWDHTFGLNALGIPCYASQETFNKMRFENTSLLEIAKKLSKEDDYKESSLYKSLSNEMSFCIDHMMVEYKKDFSKIKLCLPSNRIPLYSAIPSCYGNIHAYPDPNFLHSNDSVLILASTDKILFAGDALYRHFDIDASHDDKWLETRLPIAKHVINELNAMDFELAITGHGYAMTKEELLDDLIESYFWIN